MNNEDTYNKANQPDSAPPLGLFRALWRMALGGGPYCLDSLMGGISSEFIVNFFMKHQAASANG